jgi:hypothetical protein
MSTRELYNALSRTVTDRGMDARATFAMLTSASLGNLSSDNAIAAMRHAYTVGPSHRGNVVTIHDGFVRGCTEYRADTATFRVIVDRG